MTKYHAKKTEIEGRVFDSRREAYRYQELKLLEAAGEIEQLELQPRYELLVQGGGCVGMYIADFRYYDKKNGVAVVEDVKGVRTPIYRLKKKIVETVYGITILEVE